MRQLILAVILFAAVSAQSDGNGGWFCNYTAQGDEVVENAVPIQTFRTSGNNGTRSTWCIAYCKDRTSLKATMRFQPSTMVTARFKQIIDTDLQGAHHTSVKLTKGLPSKLNQAEDQFCTDQTVASTVDAVFAKYNTIDDYAEKLAYYVNRPQWAFLVYELVPGASGLITTLNAFQDDNFCMKTMVKGPDMYQVFGGYVSN